MPVSKEYLEYVLDQLRCIGSVFAKRMFGAVGLYFDGLFFGLIASDVLYFKVDDSTRKEYERAGSGAFSPYGEASTSMGYYEVPVDVLEDVDKLRQWAREAVAVAVKKGAVKKKVRKPRK